MFKKIFALATLLVALPALANAWTLTTWAKSQGGTLDSPVKTGQTATDGSKSKVMAAGSTGTVTVAPAAGYKISKLELNGIVSGPFTVNQVIPVAEGGAQKVFATFARISYALNAMAGANGTVDKASYPVVYAGGQSPAKTFVFTPNPGFAVQSISNSAGTNGVNFQYLNAVTGLPVTLPAATGVKVKVSVANVPNASIIFSASFTGAATGGTTPASGCVNCHATQGVGTGVYAAYSSSKHKTASPNPVVCASCHVGADTGGHPGAQVTSATCENCHAATLSTTTHPAELTASKCLSCHDSHNPATDIPALKPSNHPAVTLYTFEEIGMQMAGGQKVPVQVDASGKGMPYSPKQTCGTAGCHVINGNDYTYDKISDHAFHSAQGRNHYVDSSDGKFNATKTKPWTQSTAMVGKW